jgi:hypothetical protein
MLVCLHDMSVAAGSGWTLIPPFSLVPTDCRSARPVLRSEAVQLLLDEVFLLSR